MKKILVTGGTGLVGAHLLYFLVKMGETPIAIKRVGSDIENVKKIFHYYTTDADIFFNKILWKECDILDVVSLDKIVAKVTHIYHCAALVSFNNKLKNKMIEINTVGSSNLVDLSLKHHVSRFCYVSSIATLGGNNSMPVNESCYWTWKNQSGYATSKHLAEMEVWRGFAEGLDGFIVNPSLIIGPGFWNSGIGTIIKKTKISGPFYPPGGCGVIDVKDLTKIMIQLMNSGIQNERFIINSEHISYKKLMTLVSKSFNRRPPFIKLPPFIIRIGIFFDSILSRIRRKEITLSTDAVKYTTTNILLDSTKINNTINFEYTKIVDSLKECVKIFKQEKIS